LLSLSPVLPHPPLLSTQLSASACFNQPGISSLSSSWPHSRLVPGCLHALAPPSLPPAATLDIVPAELGGMQLEEENEAAAAAGAAAAGFDMRPGARFWVQGASSGGARAQASRTCRAQARGSRPPHPRCPGSPARRAVRRGRTRAGAADAQQPRPVSVPAGPESLRPASRCLRVSRRSGLSAPRSFQTAGRTAAQSVQTSRAPLNCLQ